MTPRIARALVIASPLLVGLTMLGVFRACVAVLGTHVGYHAAFAIYWLTWGLAFPLAILGPARARQLLEPPEPMRRATPRALWILALPVVGAIGFALLPHLDLVTPLVILVALARAAINATAEELLWHAVPVATFADRPVLGWLWPALGFSLWHLAPLSVRPASQQTAPFMLGATLIGLGYGWVAYHQRSIRWTLLAHVLVDAMGVVSAVEAIG